MSRQTIRDLRRAIGTLAAGLLAATLTALAANYPPWWASRGVIVSGATTTNDFAAVNQGQLKWFASMTKDELDARLPCGAGSNVAALVASFTPSNNFLPVNLGQLKCVAKPFYDRLIETGCANAYPWTTNTAADDRDFAPANLGQLKTVFNFDLSRIDVDGDNLRDEWERRYAATIPIRHSIPSCGVRIAELGRCNNYVAGVRSATQAYPTNDLVYLTDAYNGLCILDATDPRAISCLGVSGTADQSWDVVVTGHIAAVADISSVRILDTATPTGMTPLAAIPAYVTYGVAIRNDVLYVADMTSLRAYRIANPAAPQLVYDDTEAQHTLVSISCTIAGNILYVADYLGVVLFDIADPATPVYLTTWTNIPGATYGVIDVAVAGGFAFVIGGEGRFAAIDATDIMNPVVVHESADLGDNLQFLDFDEPFLYVSGWCGTVNVYNMEDPSSPYLAYAANYGEARGIAHTTNRVYIAAGESGLVVLGKTPIPGDADGDRLWDEWEKQHFGNLDQNGRNDPDNDGLPNLAEYACGTDPLNPDTDGDGLADGAEVWRWLTNPLLADTDDDRSSDRDELRCGTDPADGNSFPARISGLFTGSWTRTGLTNWVIVTTDSVDRTSAFVTQVSAFSSSFTITNVPTLRTYWIRAFHDASGNNAQDYWEPCGAATIGPVFLTGNLDNVTIALADPDTDADGLPDWWELRWFGNTNQSGNSDADSDGTSNRDEWSNNLCPTNPAQYLVSVAGSVTYTGAQPGPTLVVASPGVGTVFSSRSYARTNSTFAIDNVRANLPFRLWAFKDVNGNLRLDPGEALGEWSQNPTSLAASVSGILIALTDPSTTDLDSDGLPDWWEVRWFGSVLPATGQGDNDGDGLRNSLEYAYSTSPTAADTDADGWADGTEVSPFGTDPLSPVSHPVSVSVSLIYSGPQYGVFHVLAATNADNWTSPIASSCAGQAECALAVSPGTNFWIKAWLDANADGDRDIDEPCGTFAANPFVASNGLSNCVAVVCSDPDTDADELPDWWEMKHFGNLAGGPNDDHDGDGTSDLNEYRNGLDPTNSVSLAVTLSGIVTATDSQTGAIRVLTTAREDSWDSPLSTDLSAPGAFTIAGVPAPATYWVKAYRDVNTNGACDDWEPAGVWTQGAAAIVASVSGIQITVSEMDSDNDGLPDSWEREIIEADPDDRLTTVFHVLPGDDFDQDGIGNADEYRCGSSPTNALSQPARLRFDVAQSSTPGVDTSVSLRVVLTSPAAQSVTGMVRWTGGSATRGADFAFADTAVVFAPGQTSATVQVSIYANAAGEPTKDALFTVALVAGPAVLGTPSTHRLVILGDTADSDGDGLPDWWETLYFGSPTAASPGADPDNDGWDNLAEYRRGGNPLQGSVPDSADTLRLRLHTPLMDHP